MRYIIKYSIFEAYEDTIGSGGLNVVSEIDNDWILKEPKNIYNLSYNVSKDIEKYYGKGMPGVLKYFREYIMKMKENPDIFPKVKLLSKNRAAIERCDTDTAIDYYYHFYNKITRNGYLDIPDYGKGYYTPHEFGLLIGKANSRFTKSILRYTKDNFMDDKICKEFYLLIKLISKKFKFVDFKPSNLGIDKSGKLKLIDY